MFDASEELGIMYDKLIHYGQFVWINIVFEAWGKAYSDAYNNIKEVLKQKPSNDTAAAFVKGYIGIMLGPASIGVKIIFVPLTSALNSIFSSNPSPVPRVIDMNPENFMYDRKAEFANMLVACSSAINILRDKARNGSAGVSEPDFKKFLNDVAILANLVSASQS